MGWWNGGMEWNVDEVDGLMGSHLIANYHL